MLRDQRHRLTPIARPCHHGNVFLDLEQSGERAQHHRLVFRQDDANLFAHGSSDPSTSTELG